MTRATRYDPLPPSVWPSHASVRMTPARREPFQFFNAIGQGLLRFASRGPIASPRASCLIEARLCEVDQAEARDSI